MLPINTIKDTSLRNMVYGLKHVSNICTLTGFLKIWEYHNKCRRDLLIRYK